MIPPLPGDTPQVKLINECFREANEMNWDIIGRYLHKDFRHVVHPKSLGVPALNKEAFLKRYAELGTGYGLTFHSVVEAPGKVVVHATLEVENPYALDTKCEGVYITHFGADDDGNLKVNLIDEFTDSKVYSEVHQALAAAKAG